MLSVSDKAKPIRHKSCTTVQSHYENIYLCTGLVQILLPGKFYPTIKTIYILDALRYSFSFYVFCMILIIVNPAPSANASTAVINNKEDTDTMDLYKMESSL